MQPSRLSVRGGRQAVLVVAVALVVTGVHTLSGSFSVTATAAPRTLAETAPTAAHRINADFDGDGFGDLVIGAVDSAPGPEGEQFPTVHVLYGSPGGVDAARSQQLSSSDFGLAGSYDFASALAAGDFDGDGLSDLAIGDRGSRGGRVVIVHGSRTGLDRARRQVWSQDSPGVIGADEFDDGEGDEFGATLVAANLGRGPEDDLAIGAPHENDAGSVSILFGSARGLSATGNQRWSQNSPGVPGQEEEFDTFGLSLAAGHFRGGPYAELAIGVPGEDFGPVDDFPRHRYEDGGGVLVLRGGRTGVSASGVQWWTRNSPGVKGRPIAGDQFGRSLAAGHFAGRRFDDLAIGAPSYEAQDDLHAYAGKVNVLYGSAAGLTATGDQLITQDTPGVAGSPDIGDEFGASLVAADFGHRSAAGERFDDLAVSAPGEHRGPYRENVVHVLFGTRSGLTGRDSQTLTQGLGLGAQRRRDNAFGIVMTAGSFGRDDATDDADLVVGNATLGSVTGTRIRCSTPVTVAYGHQNGLDPAGRQTICRSDLPDAPAYSESFGFSLGAAPRHSSRRCGYRGCYQ